MDIVHQRGRPVIPLGSLGEILASLSRVCPEPSEAHQRPFTLRLRCPTDAGIELRYDGKSREHAEAVLFMDVMFELLRDECGSRLPSVRQRLLAPLPVGVLL
jgi:hypothetical protein